MPNGPYVRVGDDQITQDDTRADITPLPEFNKIPHLRSHIQDALSKGANIANKYGGESYEALMVPAVLTGSPKR